VVIDQPLLELENGIVESGKPFLGVVRVNALRSNDCGDEKSFVYIDATANRVNNFNSTPPLKLVVEEEDSD
jgi:hypothetical protein